jgi:hypothetical protein
MEQSSSREAASRLATPEISSFMEPGCSLQYKQEPTESSYRKPDESNPCNA